MKRLLPGHTDVVNAVKFFPYESASQQILLSGSVDKTVRVWRLSQSGPENIAVLEGHTSSVNCLAVFPGSSIIASGSADSSIKIWRLDLGQDLAQTELLQTIPVIPRFFPLAIALYGLGQDGDFLLAVAGTKSIVQIYISCANGPFNLQATLTGHEGWVRSLSISKETSSPQSDLLLASASQDKYVRLWRIAARRKTAPAQEADPLGVFEESLSNKRHKLKGTDGTFLLTFEALLLGHEDWIYTVSWHLNGTRLRLLSASADNSVAIWESDPSSGIWICTTRLGEISAQKGSTTATGSTGGFWIGLWSPNGEGILSLGRTGSWRLWNYDRDVDRWEQGIGISGHTKAVTDIAWSEGGEYLLSTGSDQTTRLHAEWKRQAISSWHEMGRPQIHGYDLNCIDSIGQTQFISGADEKSLRVFDESRATALLLEDLCGIRSKSMQELPDAANIPMLSLSNKAVDSVNQEKDNVNEEDDAELRGSTHVVDRQEARSNHPPFEDHLARHTLWPEREKLYGHGYEISAVAASNDGALVATSCRASSLEHAVIRLYTTKDWREVKPALAAHSLTCTALAFSKDDRYLLSAGRDRQWAIFERDGMQKDRYLLKHSNPKGHSRMILDACWAPLAAGRIFATAGRDKAVRLWTMTDEGVYCSSTLMTSTAVTAVDLAHTLVNGDLLVATGSETGGVEIHAVHVGTWTVTYTSEISPL